MVRPAMTITSKFYTITVFGIVNTLTMSHIDLWLFLWMLLPSLVFLKCIAVGHETEYL